MIDNTILAIHIMADVLGDRERFKQECRQHPGLTDDTAAMRLADAINRLINVKIIVAQNAKETP